MRRQTTTTSQPGSSPLTAREVELLAFERDWRAHEGSKQERIREHFGFAPSYYYQQLAKLILRDEAEAHDPLLVRRLRRQRRARLDRRSGGLTEQVRSGGRRPASK